MLSATFPAMQPHPLKAVRRHCLDCCGGSANEVALCPARSCPLWTMRFNKRPVPAEYADDPTPLHPSEISLTLGEFAAKGMRTLEAVRRRCLDCSGGSPAEVRSCNFENCDLWPFRLGKNPNRLGKGYFAQKYRLQESLQPHAPSGASGAHPEIRAPETARVAGLPSATSIDPATLRGRHEHRAV
jgi:hypothetical protein